MLFWPELAEQVRGEQGDMAAVPPKTRTAATIVMTGCFWVLDRMGK